MTCQVCGRAPAMRVTFRRVVGMVLLARTVWVKATLCREHGERTGRAFLKRTLVEGWSSLFSLVIFNPIAIASNLAALRKLRALDAPVARPATARPAEAADRFTT